jgi:hypothetical protein
MHARIATYCYTGDAQDLVQEAEDGLLAIFEAQPGFRSYTLVDTGERLVSFSVWDSPESAEYASIAAAEWVAANLADRTDLQKVEVGEIAVSTTFAVTTRAGATV